MNFKIMNRKDAISYSHKPHSESSVIISISNSDECQLPPFGTNYNNSIKKTLCLFFDDVEVTEKNPIYQPITEDDARKIVNFVKRWKNQVDTIIVHCSAGQSRSAGVMAAISKWMTGSDMWVFDHSYYKPNMSCYRMVLNEFYKTVN